MSQKKNRGLLIAIIITVILIILVGIIAGLYFFTDIFINEKQAFLKYASQTIQKDKGFIESSLEKYIEKKQNTNYENNGNISFDISVPNLDTDSVNTMNIEYSGKNDSINSKLEEEITINYSEDVNFPITLKKTSDIIGIQTDYIGSNFVAIKNDDNSGNIEGLESITNFMNNKQDVEFSEEEIKNLKATYLDNTLNNIDNNKFSKTTEGNLTGYKLTLTGEEFKNILVQVLQKLKEDTNTTSKINTILKNIINTVEFDTTTIDNLIENINDLELNNNVEFAVYKNGTKLSKIDSTIEGNTISISKEGNSQEVTYIVGIKIADEVANISVSAKYTGLDTENINENYEISLEGPYEENTASNTSTTEEVTEETANNLSEESSNDNTENDTISYKYIITNNVQFKDSVEIEDLTDENSAILNEEDSEYVTNLMNAIQERLVEVNKSQMEELGLSENENPIQYVLPYFIFPGTQTDIRQMDETFVNTFNQKFELYESTNTKGATVKGLLTTIQNNNETDDNNKIEEINVDGEEYEVTEQNITLIKSNINVDDTYRVEFEKDIDTGLIYRAVINKR